jgi:uncharacterized protein (DUF2141 family)
VTGLRNQRGIVQVCVTASKRHFPNCSADSHAFKASVGAARAAVIQIPAVPAGRYAIALLHDENGNGRMDMAVAIPREGYGFSRDAPVRFGPPSFERALVAIGPGTNRHTIRMRYIL